MNKPRKKNEKKYTPIGKHKRIKKKLISKLNILPVTTTEWDKDLIPEFLWIDSLVQTYSTLSWHRILRDLLDKIEESLDEDIMLLGILSDFSKVPQKIRGPIMERHKDFIVYSFAEPIGRLLTLYPECPASWLIPSDWLSNIKIDKKIELEKAEKALLRLYKQNDDYCGFVRMMSLTRVIKHGRVHFRRDMEIVKLLPKYPTQCTEDEKAFVESIGRGIVNQFLLTGYERGDINLDWSKYFWRRNFELSPCKYEKRFHPLIDNGSEKVVFEKMNDASNNNAKMLKQYLDSVILKVKIDLYEPDKDEVVLGLFSRFIRLYIIFTTTPELWAQDLSRIFLRCLADTCITLCFLLKRNDIKLFKDFIEYGKGQEKLLMLHLQDTHTNEIGPSGETAEQLASELGGWIAPELIDIDLAGWTKISKRGMARECGLLKIHRLIYTPTSSDVHGTWTSIKNVNLTHCINPLHRFHRIPQKLEIPLFITPLIIATDMLKTILSYCEEEYSFPHFEGKLVDFNDLLKK